MNGPERDVAVAVLTVHQHENAEQVGRLEGVEVVADVEVHGPQVPPVQHHIGRQPLVFQRRSEVPRDGFQQRAPLGLPRGHRRLDGGVRVGL